MTPLDVIRTAQAHGVTVSPAGDRLRIRGRLTLDLKQMLVSHKSELLAYLNQPDPWELPGYCPGRRFIDCHGVQHKIEICTSRRCWQHVWGEFYCADCFPCRDEAALVVAGDE